MRQDHEAAMCLHRCRSAVGFGVLVLSQRVAFLVTVKIKIGEHITPTIEVPSAGEDTIGLASPFTTESDSLSKSMVFPTL